MNLRMACTTVAIGVLFAARPSPAQDVVVTLADQKKPIEGRLLNLNAQTLSIQVNEREVNLPLSRVLRVDKQVHDSVLNGAILGMLYVAACAKLWCSQGSRSSAKATALDIVGAAAVGAGVGALWDRAIERRETIFPAPGSSAQRPHRVGVRVQLRF
jgi:hypothetical protein